MLDHQAHTHDRVAALPVPYADTEAHDKDRHFNWQRVPVTDKARDLVTEAFEATDTQRRRTSNARALRNDHQVNAKRAVACLLSDAIVHELTGSRAGLIITRSKAHLDKRDPLKPEMKKMMTIRWLDHLVAAGWLCEARGERGTSATGVSTRIMAGPLLAAAVRRYDVGLEDIGYAPPPEVIFLRATRWRSDRSGDLLHFQNTPDVNRFRADVVTINEHLRNADIKVTEAWRDGVDIHCRALRRNFNNGRFDHGGRFSGGFWMEMNKDHRFEAILIDGEPVAELDFKGMFPAIAYGLAEAQPPFKDPYVLDGGLSGYRDGAKLIMNTMFWRDSPLTRTPKGKKALLPPGMTGKEAADIIISQHPALAPAFKSRIGPTLMHVESNILNTILLELCTLGVAALPIHDALLVARSHVDLVKTTMARAFKRVTGIEPVIEQKLGPDAARPA